LLVEWVKLFDYLCNPVKYKVDFGLNIETQNFNKNKDYIYSTRRKIFIKTIRL